MWLLTLLAATADTYIAKLADFGMTYTEEATVTANPDMCALQHTSSPSTHLPADALSAASERRMRLKQPPNGYQ